MVSTAFCSSSVRSRAIAAIVNQVDREVDAGEDRLVARVRVILARTFSPGNLGSSARAAKCFGAELVLLEARADPSHPDALDHASGAEDVLLAARRAGSLDEAVDGAGAVLALTSLRGRRERGLPPAWTFARARREAADDGPPLALLFGPERSGLSTGELRRAHGRLSLATRGEFPTLNLAQAVAATLALLSAGRPRPAPERARAEVAVAGDLARLRAALDEALSRSGFHRGPGDDSTVAEMLATLLRARPTRREAGLWTAAFRALGRAR